ncbi:DNA topoisomerase 3, partial [Sutterella sp.]|uniref:DNA topoisomerase 3 n=1 Tax=Sutterella sp. TaxID=1981025 RepID=UPI003FD705B6
MPIRILYIAEKPSVAKAIAAELGVLKRDDGFLSCRDDVAVTWCFGHLLEQAEPDAYLPDDVPKTKKGTKVWRLADLPIFPKEWLCVPRGDKGVRKQLSTIGRLLKSARELVNAGDPDREGQLLVDEVIEHFHIRKPVKRFWVSAVDPASIRKGLANLRENADYSGMRDAARGRSRADWLLGMNLSRAYTLTSRGDDGKTQLVAVGRVQTPTLAMVARRDYAVEHFEPQPYLAVTADLCAKEKTFRARWKPREGQPGMDAEGKLLIDLEIGRRLVERLSNEKTARVVSSTTKRRKAFQPKAYSLADIQIEASRLYGFSAEDTLKVCQSLYETHKITSYPRTDCGYLPESQHAEAPAVLAAIARTFPASAKAVQKADPKIKSSTFDDKKVTAHHGIVPVANVASWDSLSEAEQKIYRLVAKRYIANFFPVHEYDATEILFDIGGESFLAKGRVVVAKGWKVLFDKAESQDEKSPEEEEDGQVLPALATGESSDVQGIVGREDKTKPPAYFTEGTLIAAMENIWRSFDEQTLQERLKEAGGIGTPATRAAIIAELKRKEYLVSKGKKLHCTDAGRRVLLRASPRVRSAALTAQFETKLSLVEAGNLSLDTFVREFEDFVR